MNTDILIDACTKKITNTAIGPRECCRYASKRLELAQARLSFWPQKMGEKIENKRE